MFTFPFLKNNEPQNNGNGSRPIIDLHDVQKYYKTAVGDFHALKNIDLQINAGEFVSVIGKSGSGKTTLLEYDHGHRPPHVGRSLCQWHGRPRAERKPDGALAREEPWHRVPVLPAPADHLGHREHYAADGFLPHLSHARARASAPWHCSRWLDWQTTPTSCPLRFPAGSSNAWRSRVPWPTIRPS